MKKLSDKFTLMIISIHIHRIMFTEHNPLEIIHLTKNQQVNYNVVIFNLHSKFQRLFNLMRFLALQQADSLRAKS